MSEFTCALGHLVPPSEHVCPICGGRVTCHWYAIVELEDGKVKKVYEEKEDGAQYLAAIRDGIAELERDTPGGYDR